MSFEVRKIDAPLGAEICGIDMRDPLDPADRDRLYKHGSIMSASF